MNTTIMEVYLNKSKKIFTANYVFLPKDQVLGKLYDFLGIPNICGKINKKKLFAIYKSEHKTGKVVLCEDDPIRSLNIEEKLFPELIKPDKFEMPLTIIEENNLHIESKVKIENVKESSSDIKPDKFEIPLPIIEENNLNMESKVKIENVKESSSESSGSMKEFLNRLKNVQTKFRKKKLRRKRQHFLQPIPEDSIVNFKKEKKH